MAIRIPRVLADSVEEDDHPERLTWLAALPEAISAIAAEWELTLGEPYTPGGQCAWVAPAGEDLVLKVGWRHREAEHEADALRFWDGNGAVRCFRAISLPDTTALLLERCLPGTELKTLPERDQDGVIAALARRLHAQRPPHGHPFRPLAEICEEWASSIERGLPNAVDPGLAGRAIEVFRELPRTSRSEALLCTDLHAGNVLASTREPWLVIDPKPFIGDPAFDAVQHMLNCEERLMADPLGLSARMASLLDVDAERVRLWLFARCAQESVGDQVMLDLARRLAP